jgi:predicted DNA-binding WGR domain protein
MAKRHRYYRHAGQSTSFWEFQVDEKRCVIRYGKLDGPSRMIERKFTSEREAKDAAFRLARGKTKSGYRLLLTRGPYPQPAATPLPSKMPASSDSRRHTGAKVLSAEIYRQAEKKGASIKGKRPLPRSVKSCPDLVAEFYQYIVWPKHKTFRLEIDEIERDLICLEGVQAFPAADSEVAGCERMNLFAVGSHGGGNWILLLNGNDKRPSDPMVYEVDHAPEPGDELQLLGRLSKFLRGLMESPKRLRRTSD